MIAESKEHRIRSGGGMIAATQRLAGEPPRVDRNVLEYATPPVPPEPNPAPAPVAPTSRLEMWLTILVFVGSGLVYLALALRSPVVFVIGEGVCVLLAPAVIYFERRRMRDWWESRWKCPKCGGDMRRVKGPCPACGHKRIVQ